MPQHYVGIDPGLDGAVFVIDNDNRIYVWDTPTFTVEGKRKPDPIGMSNLLRGFTGSVDLVVLESVHSMPSQGVASSFKFGEGLGIWEGIISAFQMPIEKPSPQRWKKAMMADMGRDKDGARLRAMQLFPEVSDYFKLKKYDGRAEAALMCEYGRRLRKGQ